MRKALVLILMLALCMSLACPAFAAEAQAFVPSITYKDAPFLISVQPGDDAPEAELGISCLVSTSIAQAKNGSTDITQEERDLLLDIYEQLEDGSMTLPIEGEYVIRELIDFSFKHNACRAIEEHGHKDEWLRKDGTVLEACFDLGVAANDNVIVLTYIDGQWVGVKNVKNNGDGTVTCVFEDICPVVFAVSEADNDSSNAFTGDVAGQQLGLWMGLMAVCAAGIALLTFKARKKA